eukprot:gene4528-7906_t
MAQQQNIDEELNNYISQIAWIQKWSYGENLIRKNEYVLRIEFDTVSEVEAYHTHPAHKKFVSFVKQGVVQKEEIAFKRMIGESMEDHLQF